MDKYEVIWNRDAALDLIEYVKFAKTTVDEVYNKAQSQLCFKPHDHGRKVLFKGFEFDGYYWINVKNIILIYEIFDEEKVVAIDASYFANNAQSAEIFYGIDPIKGWN